MTHCTFNLIKAQTTAFFFKDSTFPPLLAEKCVRCQCDHFWRNYVLCRQRASSGKTVHSFISFLLKNSWVKQTNHHQELFVQLLGWNEHYWTVGSSHLQLLDMKIFVDADSDIRLVRRLRRDITVRGRDIEGVIKQYNKFVKPAFEQYIEPTMRLADIVVPRGESDRPCLS